MGPKPHPDQSQILQKERRLVQKSPPPIWRNRRVGKMTVGTGTQVGVCQRDTHKKSFAENGEGGDKKEGKPSLWGIPGNVRW